MSWLALAQHFSEWNVSELPFTPSMRQDIRDALPLQSSRFLSRIRIYAYNGPKITLIGNAGDGRGYFGVMRPGLQGAGTGESG